MRVPILNGSVVDFTLSLSKKVSIDEINKVMKKASEDEMKDIIEYTEDPLVSSDIIGNPHSCIFDSKLTHTMGQFVKVVGWYDNEIGYSNRVIDLIEKLYSALAPF